MYHTQSTEAGVQDISMCSKNQQTEYDASALSMVRSPDHVQAVKKEIATERQNHRQRGNQHINKQGQRVSSRSIKVGRQQEEQGRLLRRNYHPSISEQAMSSKRAILTSLDETDLKKCRKAVNSVGHTKRALLL